LKSASTAGGQLNLKCLQCFKKKCIHYTSNHIHEQSKYCFIKSLYFDKGFINDLDLLDRSTVLT